MAIAVVALGAVDAALIPSEDAGSWQTSIHLFEAAPASLPERRGFLWTGLLGSASLRRIQPGRRSGQYFLKCRATKYRTVQQRAGAEEVLSFRNWRANRCFPTEALDPDLGQLMERTFQAASLEIDAAIMLKHRQAAEAMMALRIMTTVAAGERDPERLKHFALQAVDGRRMEVSGPIPVVCGGSNVCPAR